MSKQTTAEYIMRMRGRYRAMLTKHARGRLLDEFCATTQLERKHAIKVLRSLHVPLRKAGRKPVYAGAATVLRQLWLLFASKLLHPVLASYVASYAKHRGGLQAQTKALLLHMSPSTMDRLLREHRVRTSLWRGHGGGPLAAMKRRVPVRSERWEGRGPGWFEADTVAHGGGSMAGSFAYSLTFTETDSQWTELRAAWNRGGHGIMLRVQEIEHTLPFAIKGVNTDNGPEFLHGHLLAYFKERPMVVQQSRSRPYHKNDNAHVEQKSGSHVRALLGHDRFDDPACTDSLNELLTLHSCWTNLFRPCVQLVSKVKTSHRYLKKYDHPRTPAQRVLDHYGVPVEVHVRVTALLKRYDCYTLKLRVQTKLQHFFRRFVHTGTSEQFSPGAGPGPSALRGQDRDRHQDNGVSSVSSSRLSRPARDPPLGVIIMTQQVQSARAASVSFLFDATGKDLSKAWKRLVSFPKAWKPRCGGSFICSTRRRRAACA